MSAVVVSSIRARGPAQLLGLPVWLLHTAHKVPLYTSGIRRHGVLDSPEDRAQLVTFEAAARALPRMREASGLGIALGAVPGSDIVVAGIDLDHCIDDAGEIDPRAIELLGAADSYAERSPSGRGLHILGTGDIGTTRSAGLEIYSGQRYFTVTGAALNSADLADLTDAAALARRLYQVEEPRTLASVVSIVPRLTARDAQHRWEALCDTLRMMDMWRGTSRRGADGTVWHDIVCPWLAEHTDGDRSGTAIAAPSEANGYWGGYRCHHAHCAHRGMRDMRAWCRELVRLIDERRAS